MAAENTHTESDAGHHGGLLADTTFWVGGSFLCFVLILLYVKAHKAIGAALDKRSADIERRIDEARRLKEDAQRLLADYERKTHEAERQASEMIAAARADAKALAEQTRKDAVALIDRRTKAAEAKIEQAEAKALREMRAAATEAAIAGARRLLRDRGEALGTPALLDDAVSKVGNRLN